MKKTVWVFLMMIFMNGSFGVALAAETGVNLGFNRNSIQLSRPLNNLIIGAPVRIYVTVYNRTLVDGGADVIFTIGEQTLGYAPVSLKAGSFDDDVYIDTIIPKKDFRLYIELRNIVPNDTDSSDNAVLSDLYHVQSDTDRDGLGDDIDSDDDNDGVNDEREGQISTNPVVADTDNDGVSDSQDPYPLDSKKTRVEVTASTVPKPKSQPVSSTAIKSQSTSQPAVSTAVVPETVPEKIKTETAPPVSEIDLYQLAAWDAEAQLKVVAAPKGWKTFNFTFTTNLPFWIVERLNYTWDFGDGHSSFKNGPHHFSKSGTYPVTLKIFGPKNTFLSDQISVRVSFWCARNYWCWLVGLGILILLLAPTYFLIARRKKKSGESVKSLKQNKK